MSAVQPLTCRELVELVSEYLEDTLPAEDQARFEAHITACTGCRAYLDQMRRTLGLLGALGEESLPADGRDDLLAAFRGWRRG